MQSLLLAADDTNTMTPKLLLGSLAAASSAFILGMLSTSSCQYASISFSLTFTPSEAIDDALRMDTPPSNFVTIFLGLWRHQSFGIGSGAFFVADTCEEYSSQITADGYWMVAQAFGILALVIGGVHALIISWLSFGINKPFSSKFMCMKISPWIYLICCLFQAMTLVVLRGEFCNQSVKQGVESLLRSATIEWSDKCKLGSGSKMTIASMVFWFIAFVLTLVHVTGRRSLSANAIANCVRENEQNQNECPRNTQQQYSAEDASKDDESDEEAVAPEAEYPPSVLPEATDSVSSKAAISTSRETSTPAAQPDPKISPSKQKTTNYGDNESRVSFIETRNASIASSRVTSATAGRRRAKYR